MKYDRAVLWIWDEVVWQAAQDYVLFYETPGTAVEAAEKSWTMTKYGLFHFWPKEPFYIIELYSGEARCEFEGWYCNIQLPPEGTTRGFQWVDLDLDLWVTPDLSYEILDRDEYEANAVHYGYPRDVRDLVERTLRDLIERVESVEFPFRTRVGELEPEMARVAAHLKFESIREGLWQKDN